MKHGYQVFQGRMLFKKDGSVRAYAGEIVPEDDQAVLDHPNVGSDCFRVEIAEAGDAAPVSAPAVDAPAAAVSESPDPYEKKRRGWLGSSTD